MKKRYTPDQIESLADERLRRVMHLHDIEGMTLEDVADKMHYSERQIYIYRRKAIQLLEDKHDT